MKILKINDFVKESVCTAIRKEFEDIEISNVKTKCLWDGENWYYFDREGKGTFEDFKMLDKNNNTNFEIYTYFTFKTSNNEANVEAMVNVHYGDMSIDDYDIELKYVHSVSSLERLLEEFDEISLDDFKNAIVTALEETRFRENVSLDIEDNLGIKESDAILDNIELLLVDGLSEALNYEFKE